MSNKPTLADFEQLCQRRSAKALDQLGRGSAAIAAEAARTGALSNNRIVFRYLDALEKHWEAVASDDFEELRNWSRRTKIDPAALRKAVETELRTLIPRMVAMSRVERTKGQFANQPMLASATDRVNGISADLEFRLRQFDINMDDPTSEAPVPWTKKFARWIGDHVGELMIALIVALVLAVLGLS